MSSQHLSPYKIFVILLTASILYASLVVQRYRTRLPMQETQVQSLGQEDPLEKEMATHSSIIAWKVLWTEEPGGPQSIRLQKLDMTEQLNTINTWPGKASVMLKTKEKAKVGSANLGFLLTLTKQTSRPWWASMCHPDVLATLLLKVKSGELPTQGWLWCHSFHLLFLSFTFSLILAASCGVSWHMTKFAPVEVHVFLSYSAREQERRFRSRGCAGQGVAWLAAKGLRDRLGALFPAAQHVAKLEKGEDFQIYMRSQILKNPKFVCIREPVTVSVARWNSSSFKVNLMIEFSLASGHSSYSSLQSIVHS